MMIYDMTIRHRGMVIGEWRRQLHSQFSLTTVHNHIGIPIYLQTMPHPCPLNQPLSVAVVSDAPVAVVLL